MSCPSPIAPQRRVVRGCANPPHLDAKLASPAPRRKRVKRRTEAWEGVGTYVFCNRSMQAEKTGQLRLWYVGHRPPIEYALGYATSSDGLKWTKPDLAVCRLGDKSALNCIVPDRLGMAPNRSCAIRARRHPRIGATWE